ncbi:Protein csh3 [Malassezia yamatoensis]|uniref:Protein csh3 n=1 Tax=Malassezia yamatoensis TaxID=253288 RepID=A0AAJ5YVX7_9BASI|nr:Protein csh3 [Malassezia yamatoensis]
MGFRTGFVIASISFVYGVLFIASRVDFPLLFQGRATPEAVERAQEFYLSIYQAPITVTAAFHAIAGLGLLGILTKMHRWTENDQYFGLGSVVLYVGAVVMYLCITLPNLRALAYPNDPYYIIRGVYEASPNRLQEGNQAMPLIPREQNSLVQVMAATNVINAALLAGVLLFQGGEWYAIRKDRQMEEQVRLQQAAQLKDQRGDKKEN